MDAVEGAWRDGPFLVVRRKGAEWPKRCIACNAPADRRLSFTVANPLAPDRRLMAWFFIGPFYVLFVEKGRIHPYICPAHRTQEKSARRITRMLALLGPLTIAAPIVIGTWFMPRGCPDWFLWIPVGGIVMLLAALAHAVLRPKLLEPIRVERHFLWVSKADEDFLAQLPALDDPAQDP